MASIRNFALVLALLSVCTPYADAWPSQTDQQPATQAVQYAIYDAPDSPDRQVIWRVTVELYAAASDGDAVGWAVQNVRFTEEGAAPRLWVAATPELDTPDGLWWVTHAQPSSPQVQEFDMPPYMSGRAVADEPSDPDLDYELAGVAYTPPPGGPHFAAVAALDLLFAEENEPSPIVERSDEPVAILDPPPPSGGY